MKWYIWAMIAIAVIVIGYFGYKMFTKDKDATSETATDTTTTVRKTSKEVER